MIANTEILKSKIFWWARDDNSFFSPIETQKKNCRLTVFQRNISWKKLVVTFPIIVFTFSPSLICPNFVRRESFESYKIAEWAKKSKKMQKINNGGG